MQHRLAIILLFCLVAFGQPCLCLAGEADAWGGSSNSDFALQMTHMVSLTSYVNGELASRRTTRDEIKRCCPGCVNLDGQRYYDTIGTLDRTVANACAAHSPVGTSLYVHKVMPYLCKKRALFLPNVYQEIPANYRLSRQADGVHIGMKIRLNFPANLSLDREKFMLGRSQACVPEMRKLWGRYGIAFDLQYDSEIEKTQGAPDAQVLVTDDSGRSFHDHYNFATGGYASCMKSDGGKNISPEAHAITCEWYRQFNYCNRLLHEASHLLGFPDEYEDKELCPDRETVSGHSFPWSPMGYDQVGFDNLDFYPQHIRQALGPLCP